MVITSSVQALKLTGIHFNKTTGLFYEMTNPTSEPGESAHSYFSNCHFKFIKVNFRTIQGLATRKCELNYGSFFPSRFQRSRA